MPEAGSIVPVRISEELRDRMDQAVFAMSKPGQIVSRSEFIRSAIEEKIDRTLNKGASASDRRKKDR